MVGPILKKTVTEKFTKPAATKVLEDAAKIAETKPKKIDTSKIVKEKPPNVPDKIFETAEGASQAEAGKYYYN